MGFGAILAVFGFTNLVRQAARNVVLPVSHVRSRTNLFRVVRYAAYREAIAS